MKELTHIDLFSGIGGFALAARWAGIKTVQFVEIDPFCQRVLQKNFKGVPIHDDIKTFKWAGERPFLITGGFPCQDISCAGKGAGLDGERSGLWEYLRKTISELQPEYAIMENVSALTYRGLGRVIGDLAEIRYNAEWFVFPASFLGSPHKRERIWIVAYPNSERLQNASFGYFQVRLHKRLPTKSIWLPFISESPILGMDDGIPNRVDRLKSLGNAVVPQIPYLIMKAILEVR